MMDSGVFLVLCVLNGWISVDEFNIGFSNVLASVLQSALLRMIPGDEGEIPKKKPKKFKNRGDFPYYGGSKLTVSERERLKKPKGYKDWWDDPYYDEPKHAPSKRLHERTYLGHRLLPPDLGGSL